LEVLNGTLINHTSQPPLTLDEPVWQEQSADVNGDELAVAKHDLEEKLSATPIDVDELIRQCNLTPALVLTILLELEIAGRLERHAGNRVALI
jgi:predicted Rossmann fold nucleotide-binding protein DprA/Smf involved in DNA uptake